MDSIIITIILSERGKKLTLVNLYKYKLIGERKKDNLLWWRCTTNKCSVIIFSGLDKRNVIETSEQHNHIQNYYQIDLWNLSIIDIFWVIIMLCYF